ncbi:MAG: DNA topoisomerase-3 [Cellvibrionaceae bacterium]
MAPQYIAQFYPPYEYCESEIQLLIEGGRFVAKSREMLKQGWKKLFERKWNNAESKPTLNKNENDAALSSSLPTV